MAMQPPHSDALVVFGATGDLAQKMIFPALQALAKDGRLDLPVVCVGRRDGDVSQMVARAKESVEKHGGIDEKAFAALSAKLQYVHGDDDDQATFTSIKKALGGAKHPLFYLAVPPDLFGKVATHLDEAGIAKGARIVVEKPFGHDLASARKLNRTLHEHFPEESIFRLDHFLGKEPVQNLLYFRAANSAVEALWSAKYIASVEITMAEKFGIEGRGAFYDEVGAIRDVVQNHLLELIACLAMEIPERRNDSAMRDGRSKVIQAIRPLTSGDVVKGQYEGYLAEKGVDPKSKVETFAAMRVEVESERWSGVPFFLRAGKEMPVTVTEILVNFKRSSASVLDDKDRSPANYYRFRIGPDVAVAFGASLKAPGQDLVGAEAELVMNEDTKNDMIPYRRLLGDAMSGDLTLFAREDAVEASWSIVDPILTGDVPVESYKRGTWGPAGAERSRPVGGWHAPKVRPE